MFGVKRVVMVEFPLEVLVVPTEQTSLESEEQVEDNPTTLITMEFMCGSEYHNTSFGMRAIASVLEKDGII